MKLMSLETPMNHLSQQQKQEAEQLFHKAVEYMKNKDYANAAQYYEKAVVYGHPGAQNNLGYQYKNGLGVDKNIPKAFQLFLESARHGNVFGMRNVAECYMDGTGTGKDFDTAVAWFMTAAERKDRWACAALGKAYDDWNHRDEEKKIYWHKKAAEYGNVDSMFLLGDYYAKKGNNQDLTQAEDYYDRAAQAGTPEMKLKVAQAFDMSRWGSKPLINLEKAKLWYMEVLVCGKEKLQLEAAKGLDELSTDEGVKRPALNMEKAYMTYRTLAMNGNKEACSRLAYCSEVGKGTSPDIDTAIMFYEKAEDKIKAEWCRKKKAGDTSDPVFHKHVRFQMPKAPRNLHSHKKERYGRDEDFRICEYHDRIYYIWLSYGYPAYLCSSDLRGQDIKILSEVEKMFTSACIHVNVTGIYLYECMDYDRIYIKHLGFQGQVVSEYREEYAGNYEDGYQVSNLYFYDNNLYFVYRHKADESAVCQIKCIYIDQGKSLVLYDKACDVDRMFATDKKIIFKARYENEEYDRLWSGWMIFDLASRSAECLNLPSGAAEIMFFDLDRGIFWTKRNSVEGNDSGHLRYIGFWEPRSLWGDRDEVIPDMPVWKIVSGDSGRREYFDGTCHYYAPDYYTFISSDVHGNTYVWSEGNGGHGECHEFKVMGDYLYLNVAAYDEEQYFLTTGISGPIRKTWFKSDLPQKVIDEYQNRALEKKQKTDTENVGINNDLSVEKTIGNTDIKYSICTFGAKFHIGFGVPVTIEINGNTYQCKTHSKTKGRIDGMKKLFSENGIGLGDVLKATYSARHQRIIIEKL